MSSQFLHRHHLFLRRLQPGKSYLKYNKARSNAAKETCSQRSLIATDGKELTKGTHRCTDIYFRDPAQLVRQPKSCKHRAPPTIKAPLWILRHNFRIYVFLRGRQVVILSSRHHNQSTFEGLLDKNKETKFLLVYISFVFTGVSARSLFILS